MGAEHPGESTDRESSDGDRPPSSTRIDLTDPDGLLTSAARLWLHAAAARAGACLSDTEQACGEVRVRLVGDADMAAAHQRYKGQSGTTDVLTFNLSDGTELDVDLLACVDEARRQAAERAIPVERELLLYIVHGALHCLGYDDHDEAAARAMHAREDELLEAIGVGATFNSPPAPQAQEARA